MAIVSTPLLDRLLTDGVIRQDHHDAARQRLGDATADPGARSARRCSGWWMSTSCPTRTWPPSASCP
ncbi:hypothetical protein WJ972_31545 [Achromobacter insuavis]